MKKIFDGNKKYRVLEKCTCMKQQNICKDVLREVLSAYRKIQKKQVHIEKTNARTRKTKGNENGYSYQKKLLVEFLTK